MESPKTITDKLFDSKYIEKCVNNTDLQFLWNMEVGSYYYEKVSKQLILIGSDYELIKTSTMFWIPRQDELQIILKEKRDRYNNMTDLKFDYNMRDCIFRLYCHKILRLLSLNDMWLIFFMKDLYGKQWVPERKSWENR